MLSKIEKRSPKADSPREIKKCGEEKFVLCNLDAKQDGYTQG
jgi:hypothetical protein